MAVAHDGEANLSAGVHFGNTSTLSGKTTAGSNRIAIIHVGYDGDPLDPTAISTLTYNGVSILANLIKSITDTDDADVDFTSALFYALAPQTGASDVVITLSHDARFVWGCSSYNGVDQTTPIRTGSDESQELDGATPSLTVDPTAAGDMAVDNFYGDVDAAPTQSGGQTLVYSLLSTAGSNFGGGGSYKAAVGATTGVSWTDTIDVGAYVAAALKAAEGGGGATIVNRENLRRGVARGVLRGV